jgi:hypothetical protein
MSATIDSRVVLDLVLSRVINVWLQHVLTAHSRTRRFHLDLTVA